VKEKRLQGGAVFSSASAHSDGRTVNCFTLFRGRDPAGLLALARAGRAPLKAVVAATTLQDAAAPMLGFVRSRPTDPTRPVCATGGGTKRHACLPEQVRRGVRADAWPCRLSSRAEPRFVNWATGLTPREPIAQAALTFVTDVMLQSRTEQEAKDAKQFHDKMMDFIDEFPDDAFGVIGEAEGAEMPMSRGNPLPHPGQGPLPTGPLRIPRTVQ
jgi:hypothetical protein